MKSHPQEAVRLAARDATAEYAAFGEVPGEVYADGQPKAPRVHIGRAQQYAGLERDGEGADRGRAGVEAVHEAEERGRQAEREPTAQALFGHSKENTAK